MHAHKINYNFLPLFPQTQTHAPCFCTCIAALTDLASEVYRECTLLHSLSRCRNELAGLPALHYATQVPPRQLQHTLPHPAGCAHAPRLEPPLPRPTQRKQMRNFRPQIPRRTTGIEAGAETDAGFMLCRSQSGRKPTSFFFKILSAIRKIQWAGAAYTL